MEIVSDGDPTTAEGLEDLVFDVAVERDACDRGGGLRCHHGICVKRAPLPDVGRAGNYERSKHPRPLGSTLCALKNESLPVDSDDRNQTDPHSSAMW
jgi:hypothetical protein